MTKIYRNHEAKWVKTPWGEEPVCPNCGSDLEWADCDCEEGYSHHDCGDDTCCCLNPEPNVVCNICLGDGGWYVCHGCDIDAFFADKIPSEMKKP